MSTAKEMKKIDMETLESAEHKVSAGKVRRAVVAVIVLIAIAGGGYGVYRMLTGQVMASKFTVNDMFCPACAITVKDAAGKLPGVVGTDVSLAALAVTVRYRDRQADPKRIEEAIARVGYSVKLDEMFKPDGEGVGAGVVATVNGKPVFSKDLKFPLDVSKKDAGEPDVPSALFSTVGKEILLQAADAQTVVVQPQEIEEAVQSIIKDLGISREEFLAAMSARYGSRQKFMQIVGQRLSIRKVLDDHVLQGANSPEEKKRKSMEWAGSLFKDADVKIVDPAVKEKIKASAGQDDWKTFWPRMIAGQTDLKALIVQ